MIDVFSPCFETFETFQTFDQVRHELLLALSRLFFHPRHSMALQVVAYTIEKMVGVLLWFLRAFVVGDLLWAICCGCLLWVFVVGVCCGRFVVGDLLWAICCG